MFSVRNNVKLSKNQAEAIATRSAHENNQKKEHLSKNYASAFMSERNMAS